MTARLHRERPTPPIADDFVVHAETALRTLVQFSALAGCTTTERIDDHWRVTKRWPSLSTGEAILWDCLTAMAVHHQPSHDLIERAHAHLDMGNRAALLAALDAMGMQS